MATASKVIKDYDRSGGNNPPPKHTSLWCVTCYKLLVKLTQDLKDNTSLYFFLLLKILPRLHELSKVDKNNSPAASLLPAIWEANKEFEHSTALESEGNAFRHEIIVV